MKENPDQDKKVLTVRTYHHFPRELLARPIGHPKLVFHSSQVVVDREAASARTLGEKEPLLRVRIEANWNVTARERTSPMCEKIGIVGREATAPVRGRGVTRVANDQ